MAQEKSQKTGAGQAKAKEKSSQKDKVARPEPSLDAAEGDEETIDEDLRQKEREEN